MRIYALYDRSKRIMWFIIICATIFSGAAVVGPVLGSVCRVLRQSFQWVTFRDKSEPHPLSIRCYDAVTTHVYVHLGGSFSNQLKCGKFPEEFVRVRCPVVFREWETNVL